MAETPGLPSVEQNVQLEMLDKQAISELVRLERFWRDQLEWEKLASAYTEDSWVSGSVGSRAPAGSSPRRRGCCTNTEAAANT